MTDSDEPPVGSIDRRGLLGALSGLATASLLATNVGGDALGSAAVGGNVSVSSRPGKTTSLDHTSSHHPGPPRFLQVGEELVNPPHVGEYGATGIRDNLAPRLTSAAADPDPYDAEVFEWSLPERPDGSDASLRFGPADGARQPRYTSGAENTADFVPDEPGRYVVELDAPDGTHQWTFHVFPDGNGPPPSVSVDATVDGDGEEFVVESGAKRAPSSDAPPEDLTVAFLADDRDALETSDIETDGTQATVPVDALEGESARVHAAAHDGGGRSVSDTVVLSPDGDVSLPNRPPEWVKDGIMYQIFPRSWAGERGETTMADLRDGVEYLDDLGVDMVWLTPVVPAESVTRQGDGSLLAPEYDYLAGTLPGGGPHGYDTLDYFGISPDLVAPDEDPVESYRRFVERCHDHDIRVVFDLVVSHAGRSHPFFQETIAEQGSEPPTPPLEYPAVQEWRMESNYFEWFARVDAVDRFEGELVEVAPHATGFFGLRSMPNWNYDSLAVREHVLAVAEFWSGAVGVDGFRCDIAWGVPKSLWQEVRSVVRSNDSEFLMLDETVPKEPRMGENAFDMHFDTEGFTINAHSVASGETSPGKLIDVVDDRVDEGVPPHRLVLNLVENHDEHRLLNGTVVDGSDPNPEGITDEEWEAGAHLQRVCWATGVLLPGVPGIYYGQERQISRYGEGRHLGEDDPRGRTNGGVDVQADVRPGGRQRAFMNWEEFPEDHLQFYRDVIGMYDRLDVLKPDARLRNAWAFTADEAVVFGRDASHLDDVDGPEQVIAVVNFETSPAEVSVRPSVGDRDLLTGDRVEDQVESRPGRVLEVEDVLVLAAPELYSVGDLVAEFDPPSGTDHGPGTYEYPTDPAFEPGQFDVAGFTVHETRENHQFRVDVDGELSNPADRPAGLTHQHLQIYVRDPSVEEGATAAREGVGAELAAPYQYRVVVDGEHGVRVETHEGEQVAEGRLRVNRVSNEFLVEVPDGAFGASLSSLELAPLLMGYDPDAPGSVRQVAADPEAGRFGGATADTAPNVVDTGLPATFPNEEALAYDEDAVASIPYAAVVTEFEQVAAFDLDTGEGYGPGSYEVPTGSDYYDEAWDLDEVRVFESRDNVRMEFTMADQPENPWNFDPGFSHPFFQIYLHVPDAAPGGLRGRKGTNVAFRAPYHYRVVAHGEGVEQIEDPNGATVSRNVDVSLDGRTITVEFPTAAVDWETDERGVGIAPTVMPYDGFGDGGLRYIGPEAGEHRIGGGHVDGFDPKVMDMVVPEGMDRQAILSEYGPEEPPRLPFVGLGPLEAVTEVRGKLEDEGDGDSEDGESESGDADGDDGAPSGDGNGGSDAKTATATEQSDDSSPGFGVAGAVGAAGGLAYLLNRRADDQK